MRLSHSTEGTACPKVGRPVSWPTSPARQLTISFDPRATAFLTIIALLFLSPLSLRAADPFTWQTATPASQGLNEDKLDALRDEIAAKTKTLFIVRNDRVVYEWYAPDFPADRPHYTASMAKAIVGGLSCALAIDDGKIKLDDAAANYIRQWQSHPQKSKITIRHLGSHTSGLEDSSVPGITHPNEPGWKGEFWKRLDPPTDSFTISRDITPLTFEPGQGWAYSNPGIALLTYAVTAAIKDGTHKDIRSLLRDRVMRPIGAPDSEWNVGYGKTYTVDGLPLVGSWGGGNFTARTTARIGRLMLHEGNWDGQQLLSANAVRQTTADAGTPGSNGIGWWSNNDGHFPKLPKDAYWGSGAGHQILLVVPSLKLIAVRNGAELGADRNAVNRLLFEPLIDAIQRAPAIPATSNSSAAPPAPPSTLAYKLTWAPKESIVRRAKGGDNWPLTWADDGHLYTAYGDANGFEPFLPAKLSMGLARVEGTPDNFRGINIRSETFEQKGEGPRGKKASGMLMVDGVLYALIRNANNAQLAWSRDHAQTWNWSDWRFTSGFGCPTFLNFGPNYAGSRDDYVYIYSHDAETAYLPADRVALARVPKTKITDLAAYEYFLALDASGNPTWTRDASQRGAAFSYPGKCYRTTVSFNAGLKRYLMCQIIADQRDTRFAGGFGIYESPEPWGPWSTLYYTTDWDVGPGETCSLPTKWMSADGLTMHLVFSGDDHFSVRQLILSRSLAH